MSKFKRHLKAGLLLVVAAAFALNCARSSKTKFAQNMENDAGKAAPTYEEWVALVGQEKTDQLYAGIGQDNLNVLSYGIGESNMVQLINSITSSQALITLVGNDLIAGTGPGSAQGLGAVVTLYLLKQVDAQMLSPVVMSSNLPNTGGLCGGLQISGNCGNADTIVNLAQVVNLLQAAGTLQTKLVDLFGPAGFNLQRSLSGANDTLYVRRLARVVSHVDSELASPVCAGRRVCQLLTDLSAAEIQQRLAPLIMAHTASGMDYADRLVETMQMLTVAEVTSRMVPVVQNIQLANVTAKLARIVNLVSDGTKLGYLIKNTTTIATLVNLLDNIQDPDRMADLINRTENAATWTGQVSPAETWGVPVKAAPFATAPTAATITGNIVGGVLQDINVTVAGANYLPGISLTFSGCTTQPTVHLQQLGGALTVGVSSASGPHYVVSGGANCDNGATQPATIVTAGTQTGMQRLVATINGLTPASTYYKLLNLVDGVSDMNKMVQLVQDVHTVGDVYDLVNNMAGVVGATCTVANGTDTVTVTGGGATTDATATAFIVGNQIAYVRVLTGGVGYTSQPTITVPGCTGVTFTAVGPVAAGAPITQITANNPMNNLTQVVELMTLANMSRLRQVMDGQRIFDNTNEAQQTNAALTTTYLGKLRVLMVNLSQPQEGTLKVGELLNGVTLPDKIIDLIWGVSVTTNLATVINGIFKSTEVPGCSDGSASDADGTSATPASGAAYQYNLGVGNTTGADAGTCEASGNGAFWGERDRAVLTLVHLVENVTSSAKLVTMIDNITPAKVIDLVNHVSTYSQHEDANTHVYPRGAAGDALNTAALSAGGRRLVKIVENTTTISQLVFVTNNVSSIIKMSKLVSFMDIGAGPTDGTGKLAVLINAVTGLNCYNSATVPGRGDTTDANPDDSVGCNALGSSNAQGMGKMVNVIEFVDGATTSAAMVQLKNLMNDVTDINKMADLINQTLNSSNIVGLLNGVTDPRYGTSTTDLVSLMNNMPRGEITKLVSLVGEIGNATGTATATFPGQDHVLIAQLMAPYNAANITTTSGVGVATMSTMMGTLGISGSLGASGITGGQNYTSSPTVGGLNAGGGTGATATATVPANITVPSSQLGAITRITLTDEGVCTVAPTAVTAVAGGGSGATFTVVSAPRAATGSAGDIISPTAQFKVKAVYINNGGAGYTAAANALTFNGTCSTAPVAATQVNGVISVSVTAGGTGYTDSFTGVTFTGGGGTGATATALVAGPINTLGSFYGGAGYTTGQVCPIRGAGGTGATCTVTAPAGAVTGCSAIAGGSGYIDNQIVSIGGGAVIRATVVAGAITGYTVENGGCGYSGTPSLVVASGANECGTAPAATTVTVAAGVVTGVTGGLGGTGCPANPTVTVGNAPYAAHGDGATAIIQNVTGGQVVAISLSPAADSLAQLLTNTEKAPGSAAINYNGTTTPNVSAREGMVRMLHHGVRHTSAGYLAANGGAFGLNNFVDYPGIGSVHIGQNVLGAISGTSVMTVVNMLNNDTTSLTDLVTLIGCGDHVEFARTAPLTDNDFHFFCSGHSPSLW